MFILFELSSSRADSNSLRDNDCMGYTLEETEALEWVSQNPEYRSYKYCPNKEIRV
jgi:hypothetical protein